jgi:competence protein ComEA
VNTATEAERGSLPGVGPVIAKRIIEGRPHRSVDDLEREEIRPLVAVD